MELVALEPCPFLFFGENKCTIQQPLEGACADFVSVLETWFGLRHKLALLFFVIQCVCLSLKRGSPFALLVGLSLVLMLLLLNPLPKLVKWFSSDLQLRRLRFFVSLAGREPRCQDPGQVIRKIHQFGSEVGVQRFWVNCKALTRPHPKWWFIWGVTPPNNIFQVGEIL